MQLRGLHHVTMITGDARRNVAFYADLLGLRMVKKTVNFDQPDAYHLYFGDEEGTPGTILTWFEFPLAAPGRPGAGEIHRLTLGVASAGALDFWSDRLASAGVATEREGDRLRFSDPDGLALELAVSDRHEPALVAQHPAIRSEDAIGGVLGARAYADPARGTEVLLGTVLGFEEAGENVWRLDGGPRTFTWAYDPPPAERGRPGAGTVHHIAWAARDEDHLNWQGRLRRAGAFATDVRDRDYFRSIYFHEPNGILFEIATLSPGFAIDEDPQHLGEALRLPAQHEHLRETLERILTPVENPRAVRA